MAGKNFEQEVLYLKGVSIAKNGDFLFQAL